MKVPHGWKLVHLRELLDSLEAGVSVLGEGREVADGEPAVLRVSAVTSGKFLPHEAKAVRRDELPRLGTHVAGDCVLVNRANGSANLVGSAVYVECENANRFLSDKLWQIRPKAGTALGTFLGWLLASGGFRREVLNRSSGGTGMLNIGASAYLGIPVAAPPVREQERISSVLAAWQDGCAALEKLIERARQLKHGLMQQLLMGQRRFPKFSGRWMTCRLGELFSERVEVSRTDLPLVAITGQNGVVPRDTLAKRDTSSQDKSKYLRIAPGDIGYNTMRMWQGVAGLSRVEGIVSPAYTICIPSARIDGQFAAYLFKHRPVINLFRRYSQGLVDDTLSLKFANFAEIHVTIPEVREQKRIAEILSTCDHEIELLEKELAALIEQKRGLMQKLLTGEVRTKVIDS